MRDYAYHALSIDVDNVDRKFHERRGGRWGIIYCLSPSASFKPNRHLLFSISSFPGDLAKTTEPTFSHLSGGCHQIQTWGWQARFVGIHFPQHFRPAFRWIHTWFGITAGFILAVTFFTGSFAEFHQEARPFRAMDPSGEISFDRAALAVRQVAPDSRTTRVRFLQRADDPWVSTVKSTSNRTQRVACQRSVVLAAWEEKGSQRRRSSAERNRSAAQGESLEIPVFGLHLFSKELLS